MSMLFNRNLRVPAEESAVQIANRTRIKPLNPFTAAEAKAKGRKDVPVPVSRPQLWDSVPQVFQPADDMPRPPESPAVTV